MTKLKSPNRNVENVAYRERTPAYIQSFLKKHINYFKLGVNEHFMSMTFPKLLGFKLFS